MSVLYKIDNNGVVNEIHKFVAHRFMISDSEDPDIAAGSFLYTWENSDQGKFIMKNAYETPTWHRHLHPDLYGYEYVIVASMEKKKLTEYYLRWGKEKK